MNLALVQCKRTTGDRWVTLLSSGRGRGKSHLSQFETVTNMSHYTKKDKRRILAIDFSD